MSSTTYSRFVVIMLFVFVVLKYAQYHTTKSVLLNHLSNLRQDIFYCKYDLQQEIYRLEKLLLTCNTTVSVNKHF